MAMRAVVRRVSATKGSAMSQKINLSDTFSYGKLLRFTLPSMVMMVFTSIYSVVDGFFISNFAGETPFAAVNFIMPFLMILGTAGFMFGTGGSALIAKTMGEGDRELANKYFSMFVYAALVIGGICAVLGFIFIRPMAVLLGAEGQLLEYSVLYGRIILLALPAFTLQMAFQSFFVTAEKPTLGLAVNVLAGVLNMILDFLLVGVIPLGLVGAAVATGVSQVVGVAVSLVYFASRNTSLLRLGKPYFGSRPFFKGCINGSSEFMSNIAMSVVGMLYNVQLLKYAGEYGVSAYGVLMYVSMIFNGIFIGYVVGYAPIVSYHYGAGNHKELRSLRRKSTVLILIFSVAMFALSEALASPLSQLFVGYNDALLEMTKRGFVIYSFAFLFMGFAIFASSFFTALNDGLTSAVISFLRTLVFQVAAVMLMPLIWDIDGIWLSIVVAEVSAVLVSVAFLVGLRRKYHY